MFSRKQSTPSKEHRSSPETIAMKGAVDECVGVCHEIPTTVSIGGADRNASRNKTLFLRRPNLFKLIERQKWVQVMHLLKTQQGIKMASKSDASGLSALGLALGFHAPPEIIQRILDIDPQLSMKYDTYGAIPLHVACLNGSSVEAINLLLQYDDDSAHVKDANQRVPLHHAVEFACRPRDEQEQDDESMEEQNDMEDLQVIWSICNKAPGTVHASDIHGDTPVDIVQIVKAELKGEESDKAYIRCERIYQVLKATSVKVYRNTKEQWETHHVKRTRETEESTIYDMDIDADVSSQVSSVLSIEAMSIDSKSSKEKKSKSFFKKRLRRKSKR